MAKKIIQKPKREHMVSSYDEELRRLSSIVLAMGSQVRDVIHIAQKALHHTSINLSDQAEASDVKVNQYDIALEKGAIALLALRQPMAVDLRFVITILKVATILERMGDLAKNIAKRALDVRGPVSAPCLALLEEITDCVTRMIIQFLSAFEHRNEIEAVEVWEQDQNVNDLYSRLYQLVQDDMGQHPQHISALLHVLFAAKNFERIGDYAAKCAKHVYYMVTGSFPQNKKLPHLMDEE